MIFSSSTFLVFFIALLGTYAVCKTHSQRAGLLLAGSIIFYASWRPVYLILLLSSLAINYVLYRSLLKNKSKFVLTVGIVVDLAVLAGFKYLALIIETWLWAASLVGSTGNTEAPAWIDWALPLGISFFTFQMLSALIDTYRGSWTREISFPKWCLYVSFFPQLIAGPIVRAHELVEQLNKLQPLQLRSLQIGAAIFVGGLLKKILLADNLAPLVEQLYAQPQSLSFSLAWVATLAFALQIYFDFSGYSEMALGLAKMFGIDLPRNFRYPYISRNFSEFWRRWHITLSEWLRDYLYISIGGNRQSAFRTQRNLMVTMLLGGLWHGAGWTFVFWGFLHGTYLVGYRLVTQLTAAAGIERGQRIAVAISWLGLPVTFVLTCFTWVFFRATSFPDAWHISGLMLGFVPSAVSSVDLRLYQELGILGCFVFVFSEPFIVGFFERYGVRWWWRVPFPVRGLAYASLVVIIVAFGGATQKFLYFDF